MPPSVPPATGTPRPALVTSMATRTLLIRAAELANGDDTFDLTAIGGVEAAERVSTGTDFDLVCLATGVLTDLAAAGHLDAASITPLVRSDACLALPTPRTPAAPPDEDALIELLIGSRRIAYSTGPSGVRFVAQLKELGLHDRLAERLVQAPPGTPVAGFLVDGTADLATQQRSELIGFPGVDVLALPGSFAHRTEFSVAIHSCAADPERARRVIGHLISPSVQNLADELGLIPATADAGPHRPTEQNPTQEGKPE